MYAALHNHSYYSLLDGAIQIKPLAKRTEELGMQACAMTDHGNMFGAISFYHAMKSHGVKPIIGCEIYLTRGSRRDRTAGARRCGDKGRAAIGIGVFRRSSLAFGRRRTPNTYR